MFLVGFKTWYALVAYWFCFFAILSTLWQWISDLTRRRVVPEEEKAPEIIGTKFWASKNLYGAYVVHVAIALISVGVIGSSLFDKDQTAILKPGESTTIKNYTLIYNNLDVTSPSADKMVVAANVSVTKNGVSVGTLNPEQIYYSGQDQSVSEVAIRTNLSEDLYVILSTWDETTQEINLHILVNPLVMWLWIGSGVLLLGGLICFWPQPLETMNLPVPPKSKPENPAKKLPEAVQKQTGNKTKRRTGKR
jgi:cytochrome c-type biogenesis protein CcmF